LTDTTSAIHGLVSTIAFAIIPDRGFAERYREVPDAELTDTTSAIPGLVSTTATSDEPIWKSSLG
jgi:hypothetical protein